MALTYKPFPTLYKFHQDAHVFNRFVAGPPGSGKSVGMFMELIAIALRQEPTPQGIRPTRFGVVRSTYGELESTTLETMMHWLPMECTKITMSKPIKVHTRLPLKDGTIADIKFQMIAIASVQDLGKLDSAEFTAFWLNELTGLPAEIVGKAGERAGRYPPSNMWNDGKSHVTFYGVIGDYNYPPRDHWIVDYLHEVNELPPDTMLYEQPPALLEHVDENTGAVTYELNPEAENLVNLDDGIKYLRDLDTYKALGKQDLINTRLLCRYGKAGGDGKAVVNNFEFERHVADQPLTPMSMTSVLISIDTSGIHPCALFWQYIRGQWHIIDGLYGEEMGFEEFVDDVIVPTLTTNYPGCNPLFVCDPANARGSIVAISPTGLLKERGYNALVAPTNAFKERKDAMELILNRVGKGSVIINPMINLLVDALDGAYQYRLLKAVGTNVTYASQPEKNKYSHWADAFQYGALHILTGVADEGLASRARSLAAASMRKRGR